MCPEGGRLGVWSLSFLRDGALRRALAAAGWRARPGFLPHDAVGVWGRSAAARRGIAAARLFGAPVLTLEDGFLRSVRPGRGGPVLSLLIDDLGVHHDSLRPSRLEAMIDAGGGDLARARAGIARLRALRLSKYNDARDMASPPFGHVLVVDQTRGDASIAGAGAGPETFARMLEAARAEHPGAEIIVRLHPETLSGRKPGHLAAAREAMSAPVNSWDMIEGARAVYVVSSLLGAEAMLAGVPVRCFGHPFYAGWGATEDEAKHPRRAARRLPEEIFSAAWLDYPHYFDPWRGAPSSFEATLEALDALRRHDRATRGGAALEGVRLWKRGHVARFFAPHPVRYGAAWKGERRVVWASAAPPGAGDARLEDGFLRSAGLGAALAPPLSLALDDLGIYYDPARESRLERLIATRPADPEAEARAERLRALIVRLGVTKYNLPGPQTPFAPEGRRVILVAGQVSDDASIRFGAGAVRDDSGLIAAARAARPGAFLLYKPHPDFEAGLRAGGGAEALADAVARNTPASRAVDAADEVWTITSLIGFEALLRGKPVVTLGAPFYAGWGLTEDRGAVPERRRARPTLARLIHAALIEYPLYRDPVTGLPCPPEVIVERLAAGLGAARGTGRLLSKAQGALATYAPLWR